MLMTRSFLPIVTVLTIAWWNGATSSAIADPPVMAHDDVLQQVQASDTDHPGDGPTVPSDQVLEGGGGLLPGGNVVTFRTDSGPELDWYQPCDGGDRLIDFSIHVDGIDLNAIVHATLTLAVWDVDYNCGTLCGGLCERDPVYINGNRLTTPVAYLTGANNQWSSVSFDVDPAWLVDGDNYIEIFIDVLGGECWCVECDWGELALEVEEADLSIEPADISIAPRAWWQFWKAPFDITATVHNDSPGAIEDVEVKFVRLRNGAELESRVEMINEIDGDDSGETSVDWNLNPRDDIQIIVDPNQEIDEQNELNNDATATKTSGQIENSAGLSLRHALVMLDQWGGSDWEERAYTFTEVGGRYWFFNGFEEIEDGRATRVTVHMRYSYDEERDDSEFRLIDEAQWGAGHTPSDSTPVGVSTPSQNMDKNADRTADLTVADADGGIAYRTAAVCYIYHRIRGSAPSDETLIEINNVGGDAYMAGSTIHLPPGEGGTSRPAALGHEYTHVVERGWSIANGNGGHSVVYPVEEGSCHWGSCVARGTAVYRYPTGGGTYVNIDIADNSQTSGGGPAPAGGSARAEFQIAGSMWDLTSTHTWATLRHGGFWWWEHPETPRLFYEYYVGRDPRPSTTIKNIFQSHGYAPYDPNDPWPGKDGQDPDYFTGVYADEPRDTDGNGTYEVLAVTVELDIPAAGIYRLGGELSGIPRSASTVVDLGAGVHTVELLFDGEAIFLSDLDGPYTFSAVLANDAYEMVDFRIPAYTTAPYDHAAFSPPPIHYAGSHTDFLRDNDGNGVPDTLVVAVDVNVREAGPYRIYGTLFHNGAAIIKPHDGQFVLVDLTPGLHAVEYEFSAVTLAALGLDGPYSFSLSVPGAQGLMTSAYSHTLFQAAGAALGGLVADQGVDTDGDTLFNCLEAELELDVSVAGTYFADAHLRDMEGLHIVSTNTADLYDVGANTVMLRFDGVAIRREVRDGPYQIDVTLWNDDGVLIGRRAEVSAAYTSDQFQLAKDQQFEFTITDSGEDTNGNGYYEFLRLDLTVSSPIRTGTHRVDGYLCHDEDVLAFAGATVDLAATPQAATLLFTGMQIYASGQNGPYTITLVVFDETETRVVKFSEIHQTNAYLYTEFEAPMARLMTAFSEETPDADSDGCYDQLVISVPVEVTIPGIYNVAGTLYDTAQSEMLTLSVDVALAAGSQYVQLAFSGQVIHRHRVDGPYTLGNLCLRDATYTLLDSMTVAYATLPYLYDQFERPDVFVTGDYSDAGTDTTGDGTYDYLEIDVEVSVEYAGTYAANARLMSPNGDEIAWAATTIYFSADQTQMITLSYPGSAIADYGLNGPFAVRDLNVYLVSDPSQADHLVDAYTTGFYHLGDFMVLPDLDEHVSIVLGHFHYDRATGQSIGSVTLTNTSQETLLVPARLIFDAISHPSVSLANADGLTPYGSPYVCMQPYFTDDDLLPGEVLTIELFFNNPFRVRFQFDPALEGNVP